MHPLLRDALKSEELSYNLEEIIAVDDGVPIEDIPAPEIIREAKYVLGKFTGASGGFEQEEDYRGDNGPILQAWAKKEVRILKRLLDKYDEAGQPKARPPAPPVSAGLLVEYRGVHYQLSHPAGPRLGWIANRQVDGKRFRLKAKQMAAVRPVQNAVTAQPSLQEANASGVAH
jgi:hypothetical protein